MSSDLSAWWDILGTGIQSAFAWAGFNRDAFADNVGWRQAQKYQQKNYHISWIAVARDDIRDMMSISVNRLNNFMIVNGLILGVAGGAITSTPATQESSKFLIAAFLVSVATSVVLLVLAIMFGIKGQNCAFTRTMRLLTFEMRPENPADYNHDYMQQAQWIEKTGLKEMFRIPGLMPHYHAHDHIQDLPEHVKKMHNETAKTYARRPSNASGRNRDHFVAEDFTALEKLDVSSKSLWYLTKFQNFMTLWMPYDTHCKYAMGMGMLCLGHAGAYFIMATIKAGGWEVDWYAAVGACFSFVYMVSLVVNQNFKSLDEEDDEEVRHDSEEERQRLLERGRQRMRLTITRVVTMLLLCCGPTLGVFGATTQNDLLRKYLWMASFSFHFVFWLGTYFAIDDEDIFKDTRLVTSENDFWSKGHPHMHIERHGHSTESQAKAATSTPNVVENNVVGNRSKAKLADNDWGNYDGSSSEGSDMDERSPSEPSYSGSEATGQTASRSPEAGDPLSAGAGQWPSDEPKFHEKVGNTRDKVKASLRQTVCVIALVWLAMLLWVLVETVIVDEESPLYRVYPTEQHLQVDWPRLLMRPSRISCVDSMDYQMLADDYRVFKLKDGQVSDVDCNITTTIMDISAYCEGSCWPVVLQEGNRLLDCQSGKTSQLLQDPYKALLVDVNIVEPGKPLIDQKLIVVHETQKLVQYRWNKFQEGWSPEFQLNIPSGSSGAALEAIDSSGGSLMLFYGAKAHFNTMFRRDAATMRPTGGPWALSAASAPLIGGCALNNARQAMVLQRTPTMYDSPVVINLNLDASNEREV